MNNDLMLVSRAQLERIQVQLNNAATAFKGAKPERDALRTLLAAPAAQAVDEDAEQSGTPRVQPLNTLVSPRPISRSLSIPAVSTATSATPPINPGHKAQ